MNDHSPSSPIATPLPSPEVCPEPVADEPRPCQSAGEGKGARMEWVDAMRGFTMLLVVAAHVSFHTYDESFKDSTYLSTFVLFRMPLFFFISGFFSYSAKTVWNAQTLGRLAWKKTRIQLLPTIIFFTLFVVTTSSHFWDGLVSNLHSDMKGSYWFTYILLLMLLTYYLFAYAESKFAARLEARRLRWLPITAFWLVWLGAYATWFMPAWFKYPKSDFMQWSSFGQFIQYFHFFLAGNIVRRYWTQFQRLFDARWFLPLLLTAATISLCEFLKWHTLHLQWANLPRTIAMYSLMTTVVIFFRHNAAALSKETRIGRTLQYIGVRTLDIYLIHILLLPSMPFVGRWLKTVGHNFAVDVTLSFAGAAVITVLSVIASNIIRTSPLLKYHLFGRK